MYNTYTHKPNKLLEFEKTICFGTCPIYRAIIYKDGNVDFIGEAYIDFIGQTKFQLNISELKDIKKNIKEIDFFNLKDVYDANITDLPSTIMTYYEGDQSKTIKARADIPYKLEGLIDKIHKILILKLKL